MLWPYKKIVNHPKKFNRIGQINRCINSTLKLSQKNFLIPLKHFNSVIDVSHYARVSVTLSHFRPSLKFAGKGEINPSEGP